MLNFALLEEMRQSVKLLYRDFFKVHSLPLIQWESRSLALLSHRTLDPHHPPLLFFSLFHVSYLYTA